MTPPWLYHFKFFFDNFLHENSLEYVLRRCPVKFWAQYWPSWLLRTLRKFEKNHHHLLRIKVYIIVLFCCFSFWLDMRGHVTCRMPQSVINKVVILNKWWWFFSNFLRVLSSQEGQYWAQNFTGHLLITYSNGFWCRKLSK